MKINGLSDPFRFMSAVRNKRNEGDGGNARQEYDPNQNRKEDQKQDSSGQPDDRKVQEALASFQADASTQASGLNATVEGSGPGLKVSVKDANGVLLRQFSADEFVRMRTGASKDFRTRGKILDQKL